MAQVEDKWDVKVMESNDKTWSERTGGEKGLFVVIQFLKVVLIFGLLYIFLISLSMMGNAFKILGGPSAGEVFRNNEIFSNPFAGCSLGILATVLVQSSSTSTSIIISMTAAGLMKPQNAMYMIMGANIGTSVTNTIVSMSHVGDVDEYRRAFGGATVHDCFNLLTVSILLPIEYLTNMLYHIGNGIVESAGINEDTEKGEKVDFIKKLTKPVTGRIVSVDKKLVNKVAEADDQEELDSLLKKSMITGAKNSGTNNLFFDSPMNDAGAGWLLLVVSLVMLSVTLILLVKVLQTVFRGRAAIWMQGLLNLEFKSVPFLADYILVLFGVGITILMQSSSVTTSTLTPLVGVGLIKLDKMFPFTVGANIGTTVTGLLSALASSNIPVGMTVALGHLFFNLIGTAIWFPIPFMRAVPLSMARGLGSMAADYRWFPLAYIFVVFALLPGALLGLSLLHWAALVFVGLPVILFVVVASCILGARAYRPQRLPEALKKDYGWMPPSMRMEQPAQEASGEASAASKAGDLDGANTWWFSPIAYGLGWYVILMLLLAIPSAKWADVKYASFDKRPTIGLGSWSACSTMFEETEDWATAPLTGTAAVTKADECMDAIEAECGSVTDFSEVLGSNAEYESSFQGCGAVTTQDWLDACKRVTGCGSLHMKQCTNVSEAISRPYTIDHSATGTKWSAAAESDCSPRACCIPVDQLCTDVGGIKAAGGLATSGVAFCMVGMATLLAYAFMYESKDMSMVLIGSTAAWGLGFVLILAAWAGVASNLGAETTCFVQDDQNDGIVAAKGKLGDIVNGTSYAYGLSVCAWVLLIPVLTVLGLRIVEDRKKGGSNAEAKAADPVPAAGPV
jgi:sodium-dependent phosphate cotransporter